MGKRIKNGISVVITAGGIGKRFGGTVPKAFIPLGKKPLFLWSFEVFDKHESVSQIILVVPVKELNIAGEILRNAKPEKQFLVIAGGKERWESVRNGVSAADSNSELVLIHDAARPFVTENVINSVLEKRCDYKCVITATPVNDTIRGFTDDICIGTLDRSKLLQVGTPQLFNRESLIDAFNLVETMDSHPTDEAMLMEKWGIDIGFAWGNSLNFKITTKQDMEIAQAIAQKQSDS